MKAMKIITGFLILFYHLLAPIAVFGVIGTYIWGPEVIHGAGKGHPSNIYFIIFIAPAMAISAWHYVFHDFMPNVAPLIPKGKKEDPKSVEMWMSWIQKSKLIAKAKYEALEEYETTIAEPPLTPNVGKRKKG